MVSESSPSFSIAAKTCTLKYNSQEDGGIILDGVTEYVIPIYQRPYSWSDEEIRKFIQSIFSSYYGSDGQGVCEPMFIGTMQLSTKTADNRQEVVDGQQRLSTFLVLIYVLQKTFRDDNELAGLNTTWLSTRVNSGEQQLFLDNFLNSDLIFNDESLNPYLRNAFLINEVITEETLDETGKPLDFDISKFVKHLLANVYFVVIETRAGLSKTLQIFNAINTTGLDLNGGDIFKLRIYEYLKDKKGHGEKVFEEISDLYKQIDQRNAVAGYRVTDIHEILGMYQFILIAKYNLPTTLYTYASDTFFERLFDTIFNITQWEHFENNIGDLEISLSEISRLIDARFDWESDWYETAEDACAYHFLTWSRYSRYWVLPTIYRFCFIVDPEYRSYSFNFLRQLSKLYTIYSIRFLKGINQMHTFTYSLIREMLTSSQQQVLRAVNNKIGKLEDHKGWGDFEAALTGEIVYNAKLKNIVCRLSAMLDEEYLTTDKSAIEEIRARIFDSAIDIEHIQAYHDMEETERQRIWSEWGVEINSIGNLVVLEEHINRSIRNQPYSSKRIRYLESKHSSIHQILNGFDAWNYNSCLTRKSKEVEKILRYIFGNNYSQ